MLEEDHFKLDLVFHEMLEEGLFSVFAGILERLSTNFHYFSCRFASVVLFSSQNAALWLPMRKTRSFSPLSSILSFLALLIYFFLSSFFPSFLLSFLPSLLCFLVFAFSCLFSFRYLFSSSSFLPSSSIFSLLADFSCPPGNRTPPSLLPRMPFPALVLVARASLLFPPRDFFLLQISK